MASSNHGLALQLLPMLLHSHRSPYNQATAFPRLLPSLQESIRTTGGAATGATSLSQDTRSSNILLKEPIPLPLWSAGLPPGGEFPSSIIFRLSSPVAPILLTGRPN